MEKCGVWLSRFMAPGIEIPVVAVVHQCLRTDYALGFLSIVTNVANFQFACAESGHRQLL